MVPPPPPISTSSNYSNTTTSTNTFNANRPALPTSPKPSPPTLAKPTLPTASRPVVPTVPKPVVPAAPRPVLPTSPKPTRTVVEGTASRSLPNKQVPKPPIGNKNANILFDYQATSNQELTIKQGDVVKIIGVPDNDGWVMAELRGKSGYIPYDYIQN